MSFDVVTGVSGMIGWQLAGRLRAAGHWVRGIDSKPAAARLDVDEFVRVDLRDPAACAAAMDPGPDDDRQVWHLAANHGGVAYSATNPGSILADNVRIDANIATAARRFGYHRLLYTSSVAVYPPGYSGSPAVESAAYPAQPSNEYGWSKLIGERIIATVATERLSVRIARLENCYGPGELDAGRAAVVPSLCIRAATTDTDQPLEVWGSGDTERAFTWVDDAVEALVVLMAAGHEDPINVSTGEYVTIQQVAELVCHAAGKIVGPQSVPGPNGAPRDRLDARLIRELGWRPAVSLQEGVERLYQWTAQQLMETTR